jgi:hypothetical protein
LTGREKGWEDEKEDVSSYWITLGKRENTLKKDALDRTPWKTCFVRGYGPVVRPRDGEEFNCCGEFGDVHSGVAENSVLVYGTDVSGQGSKCTRQMTLDVKTYEDEGTALPKYIGVRVSIEAVIPPKK